MIDNHTHIDLINDSIVNIINRAKKAGVTEFVVPGICGFPKRIEELLKYNEIKLCWGIYPEYAQNDELIEKEIDNFYNSPIKVVAIGECGLDKRFPELEKQISLFKKQIDIAIKRDLPLIVHLVGFWQIALEILKKSKQRLEFVLHSWNGSVEIAKEFVKIGGKISLSASALRNTNKLARLLKTIPEEKILFETDSPDQMPNFIIGEYNEPANLPRIVEEIFRYKI